MSREEYTDGTRYLDFFEPIYDRDNILIDNVHIRISKEDIEWLLAEKESCSGLLG